MEDMSNLEKIDTLSLPQVFFFKSLLYFDGDLLAWMKGPQDQNYLLSWADTDSLVNRWLLIPESEENITRYIKNEMDLKTLQSGQATHLWIFDQDNEGIKQTFLANIEEVPEMYFAEEGTFYDEDLAV